VEWSDTHFIYNIEIHAQTKQTELGHQHGGENTPPTQSIFQPAFAAHFPSGSIRCQCIHSKVGLWCMHAHMHARTHHIYMRKKES
jgi:hypothetical protein